MPIYKQVADGLRASIVDGTYPAGAQLPSIASLQKQYGVRGLNTIRQAQQLLVDEGLIRTQQGVGAFVVSSAVPEPEDLMSSLVRIRGELDALIDKLRRGGA
jgi:DNA-binding GntR family transcriptional regulator